ncbi:Hypothetical predicted protein [Mytilus galloprovincialis]|uniref:Uncharacterized protein n=1 Tax=Mytilus galloprovincialis TaxID=29158 RepID=A0A8B6HRP3_MYTGA|nr:Hypothetical predicted protein [Mytilus galloprovincialis]
MTNNLDKCCEREPKSPSMLSPNLTWRDVQHLIVLTSTRKGFNDTYSDWSVNGANKEFSQVLGYGLMDAKAMVNKAKTWVTVPVQHSFTTRTWFPFITLDNHYINLYIIVILHVYFAVTLDSWSITFYGTSQNPITQERTTVPTTQSKNTSDPKYVWTATSSTSIPTSFTEPTSTSKATSVWTTLSTKPTTSSRGRDLSFLTSDSKPVIIGGFVAGFLLLGAVLVFIGWKINVGRKKDVDSTTLSTEPAVFTA